MSKVYMYAGVGARNGVNRVRASVEDRVAEMTKAGLTGIVMVILPCAMSKLEAAKYIKTLPEFASAEHQEVINAYIDGNDDAPKAPKAKKVKTATVEVVAPAPALTFEEALALVPMREKGRFIKKEVREQMARNLMGEAA